MEPSELLEEWGLREYIAKFDGKSPFFTDHDLKLE